jgi:dihydroceramidase
MFVAVGALLQQLLTFSAPPSRRLGITLTLLGTLIPISIYHCWTNELILHQITFAAMVFLCGRSIRKLIRERVKNGEVKKKLVRMANFGMGTWSSSFFLPDEKLDVYWRYLWC